MKKKRIIYKILNVIFLFSLCTIFSNASIVINATGQSCLNNSNEKIYANVSLDEDFDSFYKLPKDLI